MNGAMPTLLCGLPLQLRRLCLRGDCRLPSMLQPELPHQLSTLTGVEALQVPGQISAIRLAVADMLVLALPCLVP